MKQNILLIISTVIFIAAIITSGAMTNWWQTENKSTLNPTPTPNFLEQFNNRSCQNINQTDGKIIGECGFDKISSCPTGKELTKSECKEYAEKKGLSFNPLYVHDRDNTKSGFYYTKAELYDPEKHDTYDSKFSEMTVPRWKNIFETDNQYLNWFPDGSPPGCFYHQSSTDLKKRGYYFNDLKKKDTGILKWSAAGNNPDKIDYNNSSIICKN